MIAKGSRVLAVAALAGTFALGGIAATGALAQDATPVAGEGMATAEYPNHLHKGTCDNLDPSPVAPLAPLSFDRGMFGAMGAVEPNAMGTPEATVAGFAIPVAVATTEVALPLDAIISGGHALNVHDSADIATYIACGNIAGEPDEDGNLFIGLDELNGSGFRGIAWFLAQGDKTTVTVMLTHPVAGSRSGEPGAAATAEPIAMATPEA